MSRNSATGICAKVTRVREQVTHSKNQYAQKITLELDDSRTSGTAFSFYVTDAIYFPFKTGEEVVLTLRRSER